MSDDRLRELWSTSMSQEAIALELDCDAATVRRRAKRLGLPARSKGAARFWTADEHDRLVEGYRPGMSDAALVALVPTRTASAIRNYLLALRKAPASQSAGVAHPPA